MACETIKFFGSRFTRRDKPLGIVQHEQVKYSNRMRTLEPTPDAFELSSEEQTGFKPDTRPQLSSYNFCHVLYKEDWERVSFSCISTQAPLMT